MTEREKRHHDQPDDAPPSERRPSFLEGLAGLVRDEAINKVVNGATGGWLNYEGADDEEEPARKPRADDADFNARLERALAEMRAQDQGASSQPPLPVQPAATPLSRAVPALPPRAVDSLQGSRGFGRKGI